MSPEDKEWWRQKNHSDYEAAKGRWHDEQMSQNKGGGGGCFIATAAYGHYDAPEVMVFRQFRDNVLLTSKAGKLFVNFYYFLSPPFAQLITKIPVLKIGVRTCLLKPLLKLLGKPQK